ncbi:F-box/FBD/LRR-repeat protein At1g13570-like [Rutidosis leptorrhynchoides]|uniref:F-box/FBD/LRR-repeat protein At1g13570-like n=1 Tax=Rutidosis leptorrhynchoides TaxID=125765 RepID=UPI003A994ACB
MKTQCRNSDIISSLPQNIIDTILSLMPLQDALRTSILSKRWRYCWMTMPKLVFDLSLVHEIFDHHEHLVKSKIVDAIFHVLLLHNGPTILKFQIFIPELGMVTEFDQIILYISRKLNVKELIIDIPNTSYKLPASFFSLQGLESLGLTNCYFQPPVTFNGFNKLRSLLFDNVQLSAKALHQLLSNCPLLEDITLLYLGAGCMPNKLPTWLHLRYVCLHLCPKEQDSISSALCIIRSSPNIEKLILQMYDNRRLPIQESSMKFVDLQDGSSFTLARLKHLEIVSFSNNAFEMEFVKLIMAKSPVLKIARIEVNVRVSVDEELKILRDMIRHPLPRASPSVDLIVERQKTSS